MLAEVRRLRWTNPFALPVVNQVRADLARRLEAILRGEEP